MIPSFLIFPVRVHLRDWYKHELSKDLKITLSENGWTNNSVGLLINAEKVSELPMNWKEPGPADTF